MAAAVVFFLYAFVVVVILLTGRHLPHASFCSERLITFDNATNRVNTILTGFNAAYRHKSFWLVKFFFFFFWGGEESANDLENDNN